MPTPARRSTRPLILHVCCISCLRSWCNRLTLRWSATSWSHTPAGVSYASNQHDADSNSILDITLQRSVSRKPPEHTPKHSQLRAFWHLLRKTALVEWWSPACFASEGANKHDLDSSNGTSRDCGDPFPNSCKPPQSSFGCFTRVPEAPSPHTPVERLVPRSKVFIACV